MKILIATNNQGKVEEIRSLVQGLPVEFVSLADFPGFPEIEETGDTFEANALLKARECTARTGLPALADDSGLCVDFLEGRPGVFSARYGGPAVVDDRRRYELLLEELRAVPDSSRTARFVCALALVYPDGREALFWGTVEGTITREPRGEGGFGYDPVFFYEPAQLTFGEMNREAKNQVSHRGRALHAFSDYLRSEMVE
jgi:XTP/dITP diphosphohydrolase